MRTFTSAREGAREFRPLSSSTTPPRQPLLLPPILEQPCSHCSSSSRHAHLLRTQPARRCWPTTLARSSPVPFRHGGRSCPLSFPSASAQASRQIFLPCLWFLLQLRLLARKPVCRGRRSPSSGHRPAESAAPDGRYACRHAGRKVCPSTWASLCTRGSASRRSPSVRDAGSF